MTLPEELVTAAEEAPCLYGSGPDARCGAKEMVHPECAVAAVLRALKESETVKCPGPPIDSYPYASGYQQGWDDALAALARLAGDE